MATHLKPKDGDEIFATMVAGKVRREGYKVVGPRIGSGFIVDLGDGYNIAMVCSRLGSRAAEDKVYDTVFSYRSVQPPPKAVAIVKSMIPSEDQRQSWRQSYNAVVITNNEVSDYLKQVSLIAGYETSLPQTSGPKRVSQAARIKANAITIIMITRALAIQIDTKLEELGQSNPNSPDAIATKDTWISEYEDLRAKVAELEKAVTQLKQPNPKTARAVKAGTKFGETVNKWWAKGGPRVMDKSTDMAIVLTAAGIMTLMGVAPALAAGLAATVVTGKTVAGLFKGVVGH